MKATRLYIWRNFFICTYTALFMSICSTAYAQQEKSDYQIQHNFKNRYQMISDSLERTQDTDGARQLINEIKMLEKNYEDNSELLNKALYPKTFDEKIAELKRRAVSTRQRLAMIEEQSQKMKELNEQLTSYNNRLNRLGIKADSLRGAMQKSVASEKKLSNMLRNYRHSLEQRDDLILSIVDSVMVTYNKLEADSMENVKKKARLNSDGDALKMIETIARENVEFLNSNPKLSTAEYLRMKAVEQQFEEMWSKVGARLVEIYSDGEEKTEKQVGNAIAEWNQKVTSKTWTSINKAFDQKGIQLPKFADNQTFYNTLESYLDESIRSSKDDGSRKDYDEYQKFDDFWTNEVQPEWSDYFVKGRILSASQMASIDQQLYQWADNSKQESNLLVYLLGGSVIVIVVLGVMLAREKSNNHSDKT